MNLRIKLPPTHLSTTPSGGFTQFLECAYFCFKMVKFLFNSRSLMIRLSFRFLASVHELRGYHWNSFVLNEKVL